MLLLKNRKMNRSAISYLLGLFCISFAPARAGRKVHSQIKEARILGWVGWGPRTLNDGDVHLYETIDDITFTKCYQVKDSSDKFSPYFEITHNAIVTEDRITIEYYFLTIFIYALNGDNIGLYQDLISLEEFDHEFPVTRFVRGGETLENVFAVKAKGNEHGEWILAAVDSNAPRLIFPCLYVNWTQEYEDGDKAVSFIIEHEPLGKRITVEFEKWSAAKTFYAFVDAHSNPTITD